MSTADFQQVLQLIGRLTPDERRRVRELMNWQPAQTADEELDRRLLDAGLMRQIPRRPADRSPNPQPIAVHGKSVSETIIEERR